MCGQVGDQPTTAGQHHRQAFAEHSLDPGTGPAQPVTGLARCGEPGRIPGLNRGGEPSQLFDCGQLNIQPHLASADRITQQRPRPAGPQFSGALGCGQFHPGIQIPVSRNEFACDTDPISR
jgi:hypothetical protein